MHGSHGVPLVQKCGATHGTSLARAGLEVYLVWAAVFGVDLLPTYYTTSCWCLATTTIRGGSGLGFQAALQWRQKTRVKQLGVVREGIFKVKIFYLYDGNKIVRVEQLSDVHN